MNPKDLVQFPLFFPESDSGGGEFSQDMDILNSGDEAGEGDEKVIPEAKADVTPKEIAPEEDDEDNEPLAKVKEEGDDDEGEEEQEEEEEEPVVAGGRPSIKAIKKEFPEVFKKFPVLKSSLFQNAEFSKHFTTPEEAGEASIKAENYDQLEASLIQGTPELLMKELHQNNPRAFEGVVQNWLPKLRELDEKAYIAATEPVIEELIFLAFKHAERIGDKNLGMSARHLANFVFANGGEIPAPKSQKGAEPNPAEVQLKKEREEWATTRFKEADQEIYGRVTGSLDKIIRQGLDVTGNMTERMKTSIINDVIKEANAQLVKDQAHGRRMAALWKRAHQDSYSGQSKESIVNTYLSGVKPLLRDIRNRIRAEYLGQKGRESNGNGHEKIAPQPIQKKRTFEGSSKRVDVRRERAAVLDPKKIDYSRTSDSDILAGKVTLKGK